MQENIIVQKKYLKDSPRVTGDGSTYGNKIFQIFKATIYTFFNLSSKEVENITVSVSSKNANNIWDDFMEMIESAKDLTKGDEWLSLEVTKSSSENLVDRWVIKNFYEPSVEDLKNFKISLTGFKNNSSTKVEEMDESTVIQWANSSKILFSKERITNPKIIDFTNPTIASEGFISKIKLSISKLESLISDESDEDLVETFFVENKFILGMFFSVQDKAEFHYQEGVKRDSRSSIDLVIRDINNAYFIDFKKAKPLDFIKKAYRCGVNQNDIFALDREVSGAIVQIAENSDQLIKKFKDEDENKNLNSPIKIIIGWSYKGITQEQINSYQHFKNNQIVKILTLDEILSSLKWLSTSIKNK